MVAPFVVPNSNSTSFALGSPSVGVGVGNDVPGYIDAFRINNGASRHTSNFSLEVWEPSATANNAGTTLDDWYNNVLLLMHCDGTNGGTTFTDSGPSARTITRTGAVTTQTTAGTFLYGTAGLVGFGTTSYLTVNCGTIAAGTDYTIEYWGRGNGQIAVPWSSGSTGQNSVTNGTLFLNGVSIGSFQSYLSNTATGTNVVRLCRCGTNIYVYVDGTLRLTGTDNSSFDLTNFRIGNSIANTALYWSTNTGSTATLDEIRITSGVARSTGLSYTLDAQQFPNAVSNQGDIYSSTLVLLLNGNGTNGSSTITDSSTINPKSPTASGSAVNSTAQFKFGTGSLRIPTSSAITCAASADFNLSTANFSLDFYLREDTVGSTYLPVPIFQFTVDSSNYWGMFIYNGLIKLYSFVAGVGATYTTLASTTIAGTTQTHVELDRHGNAFYIFVNGQLATGGNPTISSFTIIDHMYMGVGSSTMSTTPKIVSTSSAPLGSKFPTIIDHMYLGAGSSTMSSTPKMIGTSGIGLGTKFTIIDHLYPLLTPGTGSISGVVKVVTTLAPNRKVRVYDRISGVLVGETTSDPTTAAYAFHNLNVNRAYYVIAFDLQPGGYNACIEDEISPT